MKNNISPTTRLIDLTVEQYLEITGRNKVQEPISAPPADYTRGRVFGIRGIRTLFGVSHATAQRYKDTFLRPAISQTGRVIVTDVAKAIELFNERNR